MDYLQSILFTLVFSFIITVLLKKVRYISFVKIRSVNPHWLFRILIVLLPLYIVFIGGRGRTKTYGISINGSEAFFSDHSFINQLVINPVFNFIDSYSIFEINYFNDEKEAVEKACNYLNSQQKYKSPVARFEQNESYGKPNIILILVESLSAYKVGFCGIQDSCTPFIDSIAEHSIAFKNIFSSGIHTRNGIYSTLINEPFIYEKIGMQIDIFPTLMNLPEYLILIIHLGLILLKKADPMPILLLMIR